MLVRTLIGCYYKHTRACTLAHAHILVSRPTFSRPYPHARAHAGQWGTHSPHCFRLLTINTTHCKNLEKFQKIRISEAWSPMGPDGPDGWGNASRTPMFQTFDH